MARIYYEDEIYEGPAKDAPTSGCLIILQRREFDGKWYTTSNAPYYGYVGGWLPMYENDMFDYLSHGRGSEIEACIAGRIVSKDKFHEVYEKAKADRAALG